MEDRYVEIELYEEMVNSIEDFGVYWRQ